MIGNDFPNPWGLTTMKGAVRNFSSLPTVESSSMQGGPLGIAGKAWPSVALQPSYKTYCPQVIKNAQPWPVLLWNGLRPH